MLDGEARRALRTLNKDNAETVARHLVASGLAIDTDPELAYQHALAAQRRAGRVDAVREAVATTAYLTGRYAEALREARTVRRLSGEEGLRAIEADCERGLGRPERALAVISEVNQAEQPADLRVELAIVESGARADLGEYEAGLVAVDAALAFIRDPELRARLLSVRADRLDDLGRPDEAASAREELDEMLASLEEPDDAVLYIDDALDEEIDLAVELEEGEDAAAEEIDELAPLPPEERAEGGPTPADEPRAPADDAPAENSPSDTDGVGPVGDDWDAEIEAELEEELAAAERRLAERAEREEAENQPAPEDHGTTAEPPSGDAVESTQSAPEDQGADSADDAPLTLFDDLEMDADNTEKETE